MDLVQKRKKEIEQQLKMAMTPPDIKQPKLTPDKSQQFLNKVFGKRGLSKSGSSSTLETPPSLKIIPTPSAIEPTQKATTTPVGISNVFSNDGSFMEQFKKLAQAGGPKAPVKQAEPVFPANSSADEFSEAIRRFAERVAEEGDSLEDRTRQRGPENRELRFLNDPTCSLYIRYRRMVDALRASKLPPPLPQIKKEFPYQKYDSPAPAFIKSEIGYQVKLEPEAQIKQEQLLDGRSMSGFCKTESNPQVKREPGEGSSGQPEQKRSRWGPPPAEHKVALPPPAVVNITSLTVGSSSSITAIPINQPLISQMSHSDPEVVQYALRVFGSTDLTEGQWKQCTDQLKMQFVYQELRKKKLEQERLERAGKVKYEYDSDEETEGGTWEHKRRLAEMEKTKKTAEELTEKATGKHHIGDFLPPEELAKFTAKYNALKSGQKLDLTDFEEFKLGESNVGFKMLQKLGWSEGKGLGASGSGITAPVNMNARSENHGLGVEKPSELNPDDDEFDTYRKRMMMAYRFRPNPLNNPRREYY